ncbi:proline--tRNA ligase [Candidatus Dependentiae bacterium]|nr:proline--tRNA ligase [Candidatus Dependentiae bacterium]
MDLAQLFKTNFPEWYQQVIFDSELVDQSPTRGSFVIRPYGYALWEAIQKDLDARIKKHSVKNAYFPLFIPESFLKKEADHIEGFSPELAVVTHAGGKELEESYVVRPTSETIIYHMFERWIKSWRDLPLNINQWANVVRWEMRPRAFLRTTEFLWQEGHTAHATREEALKMVHAMLNEYKELAENLLAIPVVVGEKTAHERFAGGEITTTIEGLMGDGKALQMGTSHLLQQSFPASFGVKFQAEDGTNKTPWCTSWGATTRLIGALVMTHGDEKGLALPPRVASVQVVIIPIGAKDDLIQAKAKAHELAAQLTAAGVRVFVDESEGRPGAKYYHWEMRGVPLRLELGMRDIAAGTCIAAPRVIVDGGLAKEVISLDGVVSRVVQMLEQIQQTMFNRALNRRNTSWHQVATYQDIVEQVLVKPGFFQTGWCEKTSCELELKAIQCSIRCIIPEQKAETCFFCREKSVREVLIAKSY